MPKKILLSPLKPATHKLRYLVSNRYIAHIIIAMMAFFTLSGNIAARETTTEGMRNNIFLDAILKSEDEYIEEEADLMKKPSPLSYLNEDNFALSEQNAILSQEESPFLLDGTVLMKPTISSEILQEQESESTPTRRTEIVNYAVKQGDTISSIATRYGVDMNTILWENNLSPHDYIRPGDTLTILPLNGIRHTVKKGENLGFIAQKYDVEVSAIEEANHITAISIIHEGDKLLVPDASPRASVVTKKSSTIQRIKDIFVPPAAKIPAGSQMIWPTTGRVITQYFSWRHSGIDIDGTSKDPVYASDGGTVIRVGTGWSGGYGIHVRIDHGNGLVSLYAHLSSVNVVEGQRVDKGDVLGMVGTTGRSTGTHLHFEVMNTKGTRFNPFNYVK